MDATVISSASYRDEEVTWAGHKVNSIYVTNAATGLSPAFRVTGSDTNIDLRLEPRGTGRVQVGPHTSASDTAITGYIEVKDLDGSVRKIAVISKESPMVLDKEDHLAILLELIAQAYFPGKALDVVYDLRNAVAAAVLCPVEPANVIHDGVGRGGDGKKDLAA